MARKRRNDPPGARTRYRTERLTEEGGQWYFTTREGTIEGPFADKSKALEGVQRFLRIKELDLLSEQTKLAMENA